MFPVRHSLTELWARGTAERSQLCSDLRGTGGWTTAAVGRSVHALLYIEGRI